jgi:hypothetical protein
MSTEIKTLKELNEFITKAHDVKLSKEDGMVYNIFDDGEITLQKSGCLLWQRTLHTINFGVRNGPLPGLVMPCVLGHHGYAFVTGENANIIRKAISTLSM